MRALLVLLIALTSPSAWSAGASDPCQGPDMTIDLDAKTLPPIYDQQRAEWCSTFVAKTLLDYNIHLDCEKHHPEASSTCDYNSSNMVSAADLQSDNSAESPDVRGKYVDLGSRGSIFANVLEGAQKDGVLSAADLPLDQALFVNGGDGADGALIEQLSDYYDQASSAGACPPPRDPFKGLEARFPLLQQIAAKAIASNGGENQAAKADFMRGVAKIYYPIPESLQKNRKAVTPPYDILGFSTSDPNALKAHILDTLKKNQPVALPLCIYKIIQGAHIDEPVNPKDPCGEHGMAVVGFSKKGSKCELHLRNTWGKQWPESQSGADGTIWVDANLVIASENHGSNPANTGIFEATSITPRSAGSPIHNVEIRNGGVTTGETWQGILIGTGQRHHQDSEGHTVIESGTFSANGLLTHGTRLSPDGMKETGIFGSDGELTQGTRIESDGLKETGTFTTDGTLGQGTRLSPNGAQVWGQFNGTAPLPVCGAVKDPGQGIYCVVDGALKGAPVSSANQCSCVH